MENRCSSTAKGMNVVTETLCIQYAWQNYFRGRNLIKQHQQQYGSPRNKSILTQKYTMLRAVLQHRFPAHSSLKRKYNVCSFQEKYLMQLLLNLWMSPKNKIFALTFHKYVLPWIGRVPKANLLDVLKDLVFVPLSSSRLFCATLVPLPTINHSATSFFLPFESLNIGQLAWSQTEWLDYWVELWIHVLVYAGSLFSKFKTFSTTQSTPLFNNVCY